MAVQADPQGQAGGASYADSIFALDILAIFGLVAYGGRISRAV
jgi:hypothetical protein